jgi:hypothetical protein
MAKEQTRTRREDGAADENNGKPPPQYFIDPQAAEIRHRSLATMVATKRCYACQQADDEPATSPSDIEPYLKRIAEHCEQTPDYLLSDTPLKEAIFRTILGGGNEPMTAEQISQILSEKWAATASPRDLSPRVIQRLVDHDESYCIERVPDPVAEESADEVQVPDETSE